MRLPLLTLCLALPLPAQPWLGPYVQDVSPRRAVVQWATLGSTGAGAVRLLPDGVPVPSIVETISPAASQLPAPLYLHRAELNHLPPGQTHRYQVTLDGLPVNPSRPLSFQTPGEQTANFVVFGDSGDGGPPQRQLAALLGREPAQFALHVGDLAYWEGTFRQFAEAFFSIYPDLLTRMALFPVPGNHDYEFQDAFAYRTLFRVPTGTVDAGGQGRYYSFDWGPVHFTVLDTNHSLLAALAGSGAMLQWLEQDLAATRKPWRIVAVHHPPFPTSAAKLHDPACALVARHITPILERHGVQLVLAGHEHLYQRTQARRSGQFSPGPAGTVYVTTGGGGSQLYPPGDAPFVVHNAGASHFLRIQADPRRLTVQAIDAHGEQLDLTTLTATPLLLPSGIVNAASFTPDVAPGGLISLLGWNLSVGEAAASGAVLPWDLADASVTLAGKPVGLLYASRLQLNAQLPADAPSTAPLAIRTPAGELSATLTARPAAPGLFSVPRDSRLLAAAVHADGALVDETHPASPGEWLSLYGTGLGKVSQPPAYGQRATAIPLSTLESPVLVRVGGLAATVQFAGLAPGLWGVNQINFQVPPVHGWVKLTVTAGGSESNALEIPVR